MSRSACRARHPEPEEWRICRRYPHLDVSSHGRVRDGSTRRLLTISVSARCSPRTRYATVSIGGKNVYVHRLVAESFIGPIPHSGVVCHIDDNQSDNRIENLYIGTPRSNAADAKRNRANAKTADEVADGFVRMRRQIEQERAHKNMSL